jgi:DNA-directed RNA polymerase subunit N (RpoN/RPB10)
MDSSSSSSNKNGVAECASSPPPLSSLNAQLAQLKGVSSINLIPVRCITCGKVVGNDWNQWKQWRLENGNDQEKVAAYLDKLGYKRYCCRRMLLSHSDVITPIIRQSFVQPRSSS